jgi:hypothetical protein
LSSDEDLGSVVEVSGVLEVETLFGGLAIGRIPGCLYKWVMFKQ